MIRIKGIDRPKGYAPFRKYTKYYHQDFVHQYLLKELKNGNIDEFESEYRLYIPTPLGKKQVFLDFVVRKGNKIGFIEVDGEQHYKYTPKFHNGIEDFLKQQNRDKIVNCFCAKYGTLIRISTTLKDASITAKLKRFINAL